MSQMFPGRPRGVPGARRGEPWWQRAVCSSASSWEMWSPCAGTRSFHGIWAPSDCLGLPRRDCPARAVHVGVPSATRL